MSSKLQLIIQLIVLILFAILIATGQVQLWVGIFLLGVVGSLFLGRIYCGWICPINTVMKGVTWLKKSLGIKGQKTPQFLIRPFFRYLMLALFIAAFVISMITGRAIPALPILFASGIALTFFFPEELWHRYLCPYGTILSLPAKYSKYNMVVNREKCSSCGICKKVCPANAVQAYEKVYSIKKNNCLICLDCFIHCKEAAISYRGVNPHGSDYYRQDYGKVNYHK